MALAATENEVRVAEILVASPVPMTASSILGALRTDYKMTRLKKSDVNSTLYASATYGSVPGSQPPRWFVRGSAADRGVAEDDSKGGVDPCTLLCDIPPPDVVPDGGFGGGTVILGGEATAAVMKDVLALLARKGAGKLRCLVGQPAGEVGLDAAGEVGGVTATSVGYAAGKGPRRAGAARRAVAAGHLKAMAAPDPPVALCLVGPPVTGDYGVHHILAAFEAQGLPVYLHIAARDAKSVVSGCGAC